MNLELVKERIKTLKTPTYGHGAFGESERYEPSKRDIETADMLYTLVLLVQELDKANKSLIAELEAIT